MLVLRNLSSRQVFGLFALFCGLLLAYAYYVEYGLGLVPCPLCMFQRVAVLLFGAICVLGALHGPGVLGARIYALLALLAGVLGSLIAGRHVWLQSLPKDQVPSCAPPLDYMWDHFPFGNMLKTVLMTSGECANVDWAFLGFSMPAWTFLAFVLMALAMLVILIFPPRR
jgi:protein dithiol:quinone oxidoreductase